MIRLISPKYYLLLYLIIGFGLNTYAQDVFLSGAIRDSTSVLSNANIIARPKSDSLQMEFAISNAQGDYKLRLNKDTSYDISVRYLGYEPYSFTLNVKNNDLIKNIILQPAINELDEVVINYKIPLVVKEDTLIYTVESFSDGNERKLREVLKKLPGVEVDRAGNVTVQGKKVTKVLVEDKEFFTGDSKLAVNNIPADAVNKIEVLDNYSEIPFLKGLRETDEMAMNIRLKEDKKQFLFGDIEAGGGPEERYLVHPNLFYYSLETNINFIGDLNNIGIKSFSFIDYLEFEGGYTKLIKDGGAYSSLYNDDFTKYLNNSDFKANINRFGAINVRQTVSEKTDINAYAIYSNTDTQTETIELNEYVTDSSFFEQRLNEGELNNNFLLGKVTLDYEPTYEEDLALNTTIKVSKSKRTGFINTVNPFQNNEISTLGDARGLDLNQNLSYSRKFNTQHTGTLEANLNYVLDKPNTNWITNEPILEGLLPLEPDTLFDILQNKKMELISFDAILKDYWVLNANNHLYSSLGVNLRLNNFFSEENQLLDDGSLNSFTNAGFGNDLTYNFSDIFMGIEYKFQKGIYIFKPALYYHFYNWQTYQLENRINQSIALLLPQFTFKANIRKSEKVNFRYRLNARFPSVNQLANRFMLQSFNRVYQGNDALDYSMYHSFALSYYKFSLYNDLLLSARVNYNRKSRNIKNQTILVGIEQVSQPVVLRNPENNFSSSLDLSKKINTLKYKLKGSYNYNDFFQIINTSINRNIAKQVSATFSIDTYFDEKWPYLEFGYTKAFNDYRSPVSTSYFESDDLFINLEYNFWNDFELQFDYTRSQYTNTALNANNVFDIANASLYYQKEDSAWAFEVSATNLFNIQFKRSNSFTDFLIADQRTFVLPRIFMFKLIYKL